MVVMSDRVPKLVLKIDLTRGVTLVAYLVLMLLKIIINPKRWY